MQIILDELEPDTLQPIGGSKSDRFNAACKLVRELRAGAKRLVEVT